MKHFRILRASSRASVWNLKDFIENQSDEDYTWTACAACRRNADSLFFCDGRCQRDLPRFHFEEEMINLAVEVNIVIEKLKNETEDNVAQEAHGKKIEDAADTLSKISLKCVRCALGCENPKANDTFFICANCKAKKNIPELTPGNIKRWLSGRQPRLQDKCYDCVFPACAVCDDRVVYPVQRNAFIDGKYYCDEHRYPSCIGCGKQRSKPGLQADWKCADCEPKQPTYATCPKCDTAKATDAFDRTSSNNLFKICRACHEAPKMKHCKGCKAEKNVNEFGRDGSRRIYDRCLRCQYPSCSRCGKKLTTIWTANPKTPNAMPVCHRKKCSR